MRRSPALLLALVACKEAPPTPPPPAASGDLPVIAVQVLKDRYEPPETHGRPGQRVRLTFTRKTDEGCGQQLAIPTLKLERDLPLDTPVSVDVTLPEAGRLAFTCGMGHFRGAVVVD